MSVVVDGGAAALQVSQDKQTPNRDNASECERETVVPNINADTIALYAAARERLSLCPNLDHMIFKAGHIKNRFACYNNDKSNFFYYKTVKLSELD